MSVNGYINIEITTDARYEDEARRWAKEHYYIVNAEDGGNIAINGDGDVSYFDGALEHFEHEASDLHIPSSDWKAEVHYTCEEGACEDGGNIHVSIANGRIASFKQSRIEMVEVEPWCKFEVEQPQADGKTGFTCPTCGANTGIGETSLDGWDDDLANGYVFVDVTCPACHTEYTNEYSFVRSVETYKEEA